MDPRHFDALCRRRRLRIRRDDLRAGTIACIIANVYRDRKEPYLPEDFIPGGRPRSAEQQSEQEMFEIMKQLALATGGVKGNA